MLSPLLCAHELVAVRDGEKQNTDDVVAHQRIGVLAPLVNKQCSVERMEVEAQFEHVQGIDTALHCIGQRVICDAFNGNEVSYSLAASLILILLLCQTLSGYRKYCAC